MDIFVCGTPNHLLRQNTDGSYTDLGKSLGLSPEQPSRDAQWSDLDRDGDLDLVQMSVKTLRVFYSNGDGGFALGIARPVVAGRASAVIDVDVDGDDDIYGVLGKSNTRPNVPDFLMLNSGDGRNFVDFAGLPQATTGAGSSVAPIPDYLGDPALVVTNGGAASVKAQDSSSSSRYRAGVASPPARRAVAHPLRPIPGRPPVAGASSTGGAPGAGQLPRAARRVRARRRGWRQPSRPDRR